MDQVEAKPETKGQGLWGKPLAARISGTGRAAASSRLLALLGSGSLWAIMLTLPALRPLFGAGFFVSDDGLFHIYRIAALADAWRQGVLHPRLFPEFGFGYGQAVLNFYAPLAYWPGALLSLLGISPVDAAKLTIALGFVLASLAAYGFVRSIWGPIPGVAAAAMYTYFPYHLADAYVRGALPEHFAFVWPPLILWAFTAFFTAPTGVETGAAVHPGRHALLLGSLAWAGLVYTHNPTALLLAPAFAAYVLLLAGWTGRWRRLWPAAGATLLALALSAPLWLPFLFEKGSVGLALPATTGYQEHFAPLDQAVQFLFFYRYREQAGSQVDHPLSWLAAAVFALAALAAAARWLRRQEMPGAPIAWFGLGLALVASFMTTAPSLPVWQALEPALAQLQYPWRFLTLAGVGVMLLAGALPALVSPRSARAASAAALIALCLLVSLPGLSTQPLAISAAEAWAPERMWREDFAAGQVGATWTAEFLPLTVTEQRWALGRPAEGASGGRAASRAAIASPAARLVTLGYGRADLAITSTVQMPVRLHQFYQPGWTATLDGQAIPLSASGELGLVTASVPAGSHTISFRYGPTPARAASAGLGLLAALAWAGWAWRSAGPASRGPRLAAVVLLTLAAALLLNRFEVGQRTWAPRPAQATFGDAALLMGADMEQARGQDAVRVTLYWLALRDVASDYKSFVHLLGPDGEVVTQHDGDPGGGFTPTSRWRAGEIMPDTHTLPTQPGRPAGTYRLKAGLYEYGPSGPANLPVLPQAPDNRADLGTVQLGP